MTELASLPRAPPNLPPSSKPADQPSPVKSVLTWILPVLALATILLVAQVSVFGPDQSASALLRSANERLGRKEPDFAGGLRQLDLALEISLENEDYTTAKEVLLKRAKTYRQHLDFELALEDCEILLRDYVPDDDEILTMACQMALYAENYEVSLAHAERFSERHPENSLAAVLQGNAHLKLAEVALTSVDELLGEVFSDEDAKLITQSADRAVALPQGSFDRITALDELDSSLTDHPQKEKILELTEVANGHVNQARLTYNASLEHRFEPRAVEGLIDIYACAQWHAQVAQLGRAYLATAPTPSHVVLLHTAEALVTLDQHPIAKQLVTGKQQKSRKKKGGRDDIPFSAVSNDGLERWCDLLFGLEAWSELDQAIAELMPRSRRFPQLWRRLQYYQGMGFLRRRANQQAITSFQRVFQAKGKPLPPDQMIRAWLGASAASRQLKDPVGELDSLRAAVRIPRRDVTDRGLLEEVGEAYVRLAEAALDQDDPQQAELHYTEALCLIPQRTSRIKPRWEEAGRRAMAAQGRRFLNSKGELEREFPGPRTGPYEQWLFARHYVAEEKPYRSLSTTDELLEQYPGFPMALISAGKAYLQRGDPKPAAEAALELLESGGPREEGLALLEEIGISRIPSELHSRLFRASPELALVPMAEDLVASGRPDVALDSLKTLSSERLSDEARVLRARLSSEEGDWEECYQLLSDLPGTSPHYGSAAGLEIQSALRAISRGARRTSLQEAIDKVKKAETIDFPSLVRASDSLLAHGAIDEAVSLLEDLDTRFSFYRGNVVLRLAIAHSILRNLEERSDYLQRAEPFFEGAEPLYGRLATSADVGDWDGFQSAAYELGRRGFGDTPYRRVLLLAMQGYLLEAQETLDGIEAEEDAIPDPRPELLALVLEALRLGEDDLPSPGLQAEPFLGRLGSTNDPRRVLACLTLLEQPSWAAWSLGYLRGLRGPAGRSPWSLYLVAYGLHQMGESDFADQLLRRLINREPPVRFAWLLREKIAEDTQGTETDSLEFLDLRRERVDSFGAVGLSTRDRVFIQSYMFDVLGNSEKAREVLADALREDPDDHQIAIRLARHQTEEGYVADALGTYDDLFERASAEVRNSLVPEYLDLLRTALERGEISDGVWWALLESLESQDPDDPSIARELARRTIETADDRLDWGVSRAWDRLERFRRRTAWTSIQTLRPGEARHWFELYAAHDTDLALRFVREELERHPAAPELWLLSAKALERAGRYEEALEELKTIVNAVPMPELLRHEARLLVHLGKDTKETRPTIELYERRAEVSPEDTELRYLRSRSMLNGGDSHAIDRAIRQLSELWDLRASELVRVTPQELGLTYCMALIEHKKGRPSREIVQGVLNELLEFDNDPFQESLLVTLRNLTRPPEVKAAAPEAADPEATDPEAADQPEGKENKRKGGKRKRQANAEGN